MTVITVLTLILFVLMKVVGEERGVKSFSSLLLNIGLIFLAVILIANGRSPLVITAVACLLISSVNLFFINTINQKTRIAFMSTILTLGIMLPLIFYFVTVANVQGLGEEELVEMDMYSLKLGLDFVTISISMVIMSTVGAVNDTAMSIASAMFEIKRHNQTLSQKDFFLSGMTVGKDILGTTTNTLFFAFLGGGLALMIWLKDLNYSLEVALNSKVIASELLAILFSGIGVTLIIPITAAVIVHRQKELGGAPLSETDKVD